MLRLLANREQNKDNFVKIVDSQTGCCGSEATECQYTYSDAALKEVVKISVDGVEFKLNDGTPEGIAINTIYTGMGDGAAKVKYTRQVVLPYLFTSAGLVSDGISVVITNSGADFTVESETELVIQGVSASATKCVRAAYCDYCISEDTPGDSVVVVVNGDTNTATADTSGDFDYPSGAAALEGKLETALAGTGVEEVVVMDDTVNSAYKIVLTYPNGTTLTWQGTSMPCCNVERGWKSA